MAKSTTAFDAKPEAHRLIRAKGTDHTVSERGEYSLVGLGAKRCPNARSKVVISDPDYHHDLKKEGG